MSFSEIIRLAETGDHAEALRIASEMLNDDPDNPKLLFAIADCYHKGQRWALAAHMLRRAISYEPEQGALWNNLGNNLLHVGYGNQDHLEEAEACLHRALEIDPHDSEALNNLSVFYTHTGDFQRGLEYGTQSLKQDPGDDKPRYNMGLCYLALGDYPRGWRGYEKGAVGGRFKKNADYGLPKWEGGAGETVILYGEQGLGDEIMFASMVPDMMTECSPILDCDERLRPLFARSFPSTLVFGDRFKTRDVDWHDKVGAHAQMPVGSLGQYFRLRKEDFPGTPYLIADPNKRKQIRMLLDDLGPKKKIGLAWSGGITKTFERRRSLTLKDYEPLLAYDADFISLQYKNPPDDPRIRHWPQIAENKDMDHVAALIAELDLVITVTTTVVHLCGALGVPCLVFVPKTPQWRYGTEGDKMPWYNSVELLRQEEEWPINQACRRLSQMNIEKRKPPSMKTRITVSPP